MDVNSWEDKPIKVPYSQKFHAPPYGVCFTDIYLDPAWVADNARAGFSTTEWQEQIDVMMTKMTAADADWKPDNSALFSKDTFYYNTEAKDGDIAGRVPVKKGEKWRVLMLNYDAQVSQSIVLEYGAAVQTMLATCTLLASSLALAYAF